MQHYTEVYYAELLQDLFSILSIQLRLKYRFSSHIEPEFTFFKNNIHHNIWQVNMDILEYKNQHRNGVYNIFKRTLKSEGVRGLYPGVGMSIIFGAPATMMYWGAYEKAKQILFSQTVFLII